MFSAGAGVFFPEPEFFLPEPEVKNPEFAQHYLQFSLSLPYITMIPSYSAQDNEAKYCRECLPAKLRSPRQVTNHSNRNF